MNSGYVAHAAPADRGRSRLQRSLLRVFMFALCCISLGLLPASTCAQTRLGEAPTVDAELVEKLNRRGDLELKDTSLRDALLTIGGQWGINVVVADGIDGSVNGIFREAPLKEILDSILLANGYSYQPRGQSLVVMRLSDLGDVHPMFEAATIPLNSLNPQDVQESIALLSSPRGKARAIPSARSLLVIDFPERVAMIRRFVEDLEGVQRTTGAPVEPGQEPLQVAYFAPQHVPAAAMKEAVQSLLSIDGKVAVLERENRLVVSDYPSVLHVADEAIRQLDVARPQVRITAFIYDLDLRDMQEIGVNWSHGIKLRHNNAGEAQTTTGIASVLTPLAEAGAATSTNGLVTLANTSRHFDIASVAKSLNSSQNSRLLADPSVVVRDNEAANIAIVREIPYQQLQQTAQGGNIGTTAFREAGVKLQVVPRIANDGTIMLDVTPEFSVFTGYTPGTNPQPIIDRREAKTSVRVANGHTFVLGGLRQREDTGEYNGIPVLKDMKWIGGLFRSRETSKRESELVVFIRPEIVTPIYCGRPREQLNGHVTELNLNRIPAGDYCAPKCCTPAVIMPQGSLPAEGQYLPGLPHAAPPHVDFYEPQPQIEYVPAQPQGEANRRQPENTPPEHAAERFAPAQAAATRPCGTRLWPAASGRGTENQVAERLPPIPPRAPQARTATDAKPWYGDVLWF